MKTRFITSKSLQHQIFKTQNPSCTPKSPARCGTDGASAQRLLHWCHEQQPHPDMGCLELGIEDDRCVWITSESHSKENEHHHSQDGLKMMKTTKGYSQEVGLTTVCVLMRPLIEGQ